MKKTYDWQSRLDRAFNQRIYLMPDSLTMCNENEFRFKVMGNTDNVYDIELSKKRISCSCPDCKSHGNFCKHLMFVLIRVIGMNAEQVFRDCFSPTLEMLERCRHYFDKREYAIKDMKKQEDDKRKPIEEDDECPICYEFFKDTSKESTVWCKASCGKSVHQSCFQKWSKSKRENVDCVYCRAKWK